MPDGAILHSPIVLPGQIRLIEHDPETPLSALERDALTEANVVLYERALVPLVAEILPLGGYAEPLSPNAGTDTELAPRALALAGEGWNVVQLIEARPSRRPHAHLHRAPPAPLRSAAKVPVEPRLFTANGLAG